MTVELTKDELYFLGGCISESGIPGVDLSNADFEIGMASMITHNWLEEDGESFNLDPELYQMGTILVAPDRVFVSQSNGLMVLHYIAGDQIVELSQADNKYKCGFLSKDEVIKRLTKFLGDRGSITVAEPDGADLVEVETIEAKSNWQKYFSVA